jgi:hypothetical protein
MNSSHSHLVDGQHSEEGHGTGEAQEPDMRIGRCFPPNGAHMQFLQAMQLCLEARNWPTYLFRLVIYNPTVIFRLSVR